MKKAILALTLAAMFSGQVLAADKWWDINGATAGAGGATPSGNWNTSTANWTTDSTGGSAGTTWAASDAAIFSAAGDATGVFTVTTTAPQVASSITVEEGTVQHAGTSTNTLTTSGLTVNAGATFSVAVASTFTPTAGSVALLNGGTFQNRNGGVGSSFFTNSTGNTNMKITLGTGGGHVQVTGASTAISIYTGLIDGTGPLFIDGTNNAAFRLTTTPATYSGATTITSGGKLQISTTANVLPAATDLTINTGGIFDFQTSQSIASLSGGGNMTGLNSAAVLTITGASSTNYSGVWSGTTNRINVNKSGGTLTLSGVNTGAGRFTVTNGNVDVASTGSIGGDILDLHVEGGTLTLNQAAEKIENLVGAGAGASIVLNNAALQLITDPVASTTYAGTISGAGGLQKDNLLSTTRRTLTLTGNNTYDGNTIVTGGAISVQHANALGSTTGYTEVNPSGAHALGAEVVFQTAAGSITTTEPFRIKGTGSVNTGAIAVINAAFPTISGPVTLIGDASLTVSGAAGVTYTNSITSLANENLTLNGGTISTGTGGVISGVITLGTGGLTKDGNGRWSLSAPTGNSYSGTTTINAGTLLANNTSGSATGSGPVNIGGTTGTLGGSGSVSGLVTVNTGGAVAPGASMDSLDVGSLAMSGGKLIFELGAPGSPGVTSDLLNVIDTNGLTITSGTVDLIDFNATLAAGTYTLVDYSGTALGNATVDLLTLGLQPAGFLYDLVDNGTNTSIDLVVTPAGVPGDYNDNDFVDAADYVLWREDVTPLTNEVTGVTPLDTTPEDYDAWRERFGNPTPGAGGGGGLGGGQVPEPSTMVLVILGLASLALGSRSGR